MQNFSIAKPSEALRASLQRAIDQKTKPLASLGMIEEIALRIGLIQQSEKPEIKNPTLIVFAADHGIAEEAVSPYPQSVTAAMVENFASGGAAINVFTRQLGWSLLLVDAGTLQESSHPSVISRRIAKGTKNFLRENAMSETELEACFTIGRNLVRELAAQGCNLLALGEMGIGNTSSAALLIHSLSGIPLDCVVNRGAGCNDAQLQKKFGILSRALTERGSTPNAWEALQRFGGFEIAMMSAAFLQGAENGMTLLVDGVIASAAALVAITLNPAVKDYMLFAHASAVQGHRDLLEQLAVRPLLQLDMRLGEGTGAALSLPLLQCALAMLRDMATFESAQVEGPVAT